MSQIPAFGATGDPLRSTTPNGFSSMKSEDFVRVIFFLPGSEEPPVEDPADDEVPAGEESP